MTLASTLRYLQGERPGLHAGAERPAPIVQELAALLPSIQIQNAVRLTDVSFWQEEINFVVMKAAGIAGTIIRAGQRSWVDVRFKENWRKAKEAGLPRGSYFFYDSRATPKEQARLWADQVRDDPGELVHVADFEESYGGPYGTKAHFKEFLLEFQRLTGFADDRIAIYTGHFWWMERVGNDPFFARYALWLAWYAPMSVVRVPAPWTEKDLLFWQYTSSGNGTAYGVSSQEIDLNYYCCDLTEFNRRFFINSTDPTEGDPTMNVIELRSTDITKYRTIRVTHDVRAAPVTATPNMPAGSASVAKSFESNEYLYTYAADVPDASMPTGYAARKGDIWRRIFEMNGKPADGWMAEIHLGVRYLNTKLIPVPEPVTTLPDMPYTITLGDDITYAKATISGVLKPK